MRNLLLALFTIAMLLVGCSKENNIVDPNADVATRVSGVMPEAIVFSDATLSFASMEALEAQVDALSAMSVEEKAAWYAANPEFVSMEMASGMINAQMREVGTKEGALEMRKPYTDLFLFDPNTEVVNGSPFYKVSKLNYAMVCNAYGDVTIGGSVINLNDITSYEQTWFAEAMNESILARSQQPRGQYDLLVISGVPYIRTTVRVTYENVALSQYRIYLTFLTQSIINDEFSINTEDTFRITYESGITNTTPLHGYFGIYEHIQRSGNYGTVVTFGGNAVTQPVGTSKPGMIRSGYKITTLESGSEGGLLRIQH